jgi:beta-galactosidase GanA
MSFGIFYYPEQWPRAQWRRDLDSIAKLGFVFTDCAEFARTFFEPEENRFDFAWLDEAIDLANRAGLRVVLGTPLAAPPSWMGAGCPEVYRVDERGRRHLARARARHGDNDWGVVRRWRARAGAGARRVPSDARILHRRNPLAPAGTLGWRDAPR